MGRFLSGSVILGTGPGKNNIEDLIELAEQGFFIMPGYPNGVGLFMHLVLTLIPAYSLILVLTLTLTLTQVLGTTKSVMTCMAS